MLSDGSSLLMSHLRFFDVGELSCACKKYLSKKHIPNVCTHDFLLFGDYIIIDTTAHIAHHDFL